MRATKSCWKLKAVFHRFFAILKGFSDQQLRSCPFHLLNIIIELMSEGLKMGLNLVAHCSYQLNKLTFKDNEVINERIAGVTDVTIFTHAR